MEVVEGLEFVVVALEGLVAVVVAVVPYVLAVFVYEEPLLTLP